MKNQTKDAIPGTGFRCQWFCQLQKHSRDESLLIFFICQGETRDLERLPGGFEIKSSTVERLDPRRRIKQGLWSSAVPNNAMYFLHDYG